MVSTAQRHATLVYSRRSGLGLKTGRALAAEAGLSERIIGDIENGRRESYARSTLYAIDQALRFEPGSAQLVLDAESPVEVFSESDSDGTCGPTALVSALGIDPDRLRGLIDADLAETETAARLAVMKTARELQVQRREALGERPVETVRHSVDTTSPIRTTTAQEAR